MIKDTFTHAADAVIAYIAEQIELQDTEYKIEVDMMGDILSIKTPGGEYVINRHSAAREVWVASPVSGPYHFPYTDGEWRNKSGVELLQLLSKELSMVTKVEL